MNTKQCKNCNLKFDSTDELKTHQKLYCEGSGYSNVVNLEYKINELRNQSDQQPKASLDEIKQFIRGKNFEGDQFLNQNPSPLLQAPQNKANQNFLFQHKINQNDDIYQKQNEDISSNLLKQAEQMKQEKEQLRLLKYQEQKDIADLLKELQQKKDRELRADIEKEEIQRALKTIDRNNLGYIQQDKKKELEKIAAERESIRIRETQFIEEIKQMETQLFEQEKYFQQQKNMVNFSTDPLKKTAAMNIITDKEKQIANQRAQQVSQIKFEREKLELQRKNIMEQLEKIKQRPGYERTNSAAKIGAQLAFEKPASGFGERQQVIKPSFKEKLIQDQVRINQLKNLQIEQPRFETIDDLDVLQKEIENKPKIHDDLSKVWRDIAESQDPNKAKYMELINNRLEKQQQPTAPKSKMQNKPPLYNSVNSITQNKTDEGLLQKLDDLEGLLLNQYKQPPKDPQDYNVYNSNNPQYGFHSVGSQQQQQKYPIHQYIQPSQQYQQMLSMPQFPPIQQYNPQQIYPTAFSQQQQQYLSQHQQQQQQEVYPFNQPMKDPVMQELLSFLKSQDQENKKLREVLENFSKNTNTYENLQNSMKQAQLELKQIQEQQTQNISNEKNSENINNQKLKYEAGQVIFPDEFKFRQNEERVQDLDIEEKALMNLAAQEYDQLRVLQRLPKESDLYDYKLKQYKELSSMRCEVEKILQEQRLEKIKRGFDKQKIEEERIFQQVQWEDYQKKRVFESKFLNGADIKFEPYMEETQSDFGNLLDDNDSQLEPKKTILLQNQIMQNEPLLPDSIMKYDAILGIHKSFSRIQILTQLIKNQLQQQDPQIVGPINTEQDLTKKEFNLALFPVTAKQTISYIQGQRPAQIILQIRVEDQNQPGIQKGLGWTWFNFEQQDRTQAFGKWFLPLYFGEVDINIAVNNNENKILQKIPGTAIFFRYGTQSHEIFSGAPPTLDQIKKFQQPEYHISQVIPPQQLIQHISPQHQYQQKSQVPQSMKSQQIQQQPQLKKEIKTVQKSNGIRIQPHWLVSNQKIDNMQMRVSLIDSEEFEVFAMSNQEECFVMLSEFKKNNNIELNAKLSMAITKDFKFITPDQQQGNYKQNVILQGQKFDQDKSITLISDRQIDWYDEFLYQFNLSKVPILLIIEIFEKSQNGQSMPIGYSILNFYNGKDYQLNTGTFEIPVFKGQATFDKREQKLIQPAWFIAFSVIQLPVNNPANQPLYKELPNQQAQSQYNQDARSNIPSQYQNNKQSIKQSTQKQQLNDIEEDEQEEEQNQNNLDRPKTSNTIISEQFLPNQNPMVDYDEISKLNDQFDIYIDGIRHLPENVSLTRVIIRVVDIDCKDIQGPQAKLTDIGKSTVRNQTYNAKYELRVMKLKPVSLVYIQIEALEKESSLPCIIGYSYFPLYLIATGQQKGVPPVLDSVKELTPLVGLYQMPVYSAKIKQQAPFTYERFIFCQRVPNCTILIRNLKAPVDKYGKSLSISQFPPDQQYRAWQKAPPYSEGQYRNTYLILSENEKSSMEVRRKRPDPQLAMLADGIVIQKGLDVKRMDAQSKIAYLGELFQTNKDTPLLDLDYFSQYAPNLGFKVNVLAVHDNKIKAFYSVLASILPSGSYYTGQQSNLKDAFSFTNPDFRSTNATAKFDEGDVVVRGIEPSRGMSLFFDIKAYIPEKDQYTSYGYALCPILLDKSNEQSQEYFVCSGRFSLPIYKGQISQSAMDQLKQSPNPLLELKGMHSRKQIYLAENSSLIVKLIDVQRELHFHKSIEQDPPSTRWIIGLEPSQTAKYQYKPIISGVFSSPIPLVQLVPESFQKNLNGYKIYLKKKFEAFMGYS